MYLVNSRTAWHLGINTVFQSQEYKQRGQLQPYYRILDYQTILFIATLSMKISSQLLSNSKHTVRCNKLQVPQVPTHPLGTGYPLRCGRKSLKETSCNSRVHVSPSFRPGVIWSRWSRAARQVAALGLFSWAARVSL